VRGLEWVFGAILAPFLCLMLEQWARVIWRRRTEERQVRQTIAYLHSTATGRDSPQDANSRLTMRTADFTDYKAMLDGLAPSPPNGDLVAYDALPHEQAEQSISNLFMEFASTFFDPVIGPMSEWSSTAQTAQTAPLR